MIFFTMKSIVQAIDLLVSLQVSGNTPISAIVQSLENLCTIILQHAATLVGNRMPTSPFLHIT